MRMPPRPNGPLLLEDAERAFKQVRLLLEYAPVVGLPTSPPDVPRDTTPEDMVRHRFMRGYRPAPRLVEISLQSPLAVTVELPWTHLLAMAGGVLFIAERISTLRPRVTRKRKEDLARAAMADKIRQAIEEAEAAAIARVLLKETARDSPSYARRPDQIDVIAPGDSTDDLVPWRDGPDEINQEL